MRRLRQGHPRTGSGVLRTDREGTYLEALQGMLGESQKANGRLSESVAVPKEMMAWIEFLVYPVGAMLLGWIFLWVGTKIVKHAWRG